MFLFCNFFYFLLCLDSVFYERILVYELPTGYFLIKIFKNKLFLFFNFQLKDIKSFSSLHVNVESALFTEFHLFLFEPSEALKIGWVCRGPP